MCERCRREQHGDSNDQTWEEEHEEAVSQSAPFAELMRTMRERGEKGLAKVYVTPMALGIQTTPDNKRTRFAVKLIMWTDDPVIIKEGLAIRIGQVSGEAAEEQKRLARTMEKIDGQRGEKINDDDEDDDDQAPAPTAEELRRMFDLKHES